MLTNPFKPGAGHMPPYLAGRSHEQEIFQKLLDQKTITENLILTGLRGVGKTVLLETLKPIAHSKRWIWTGADMSESASVSEERLATRLIADIAVLTTPLLRAETVQPRMGFSSTDEIVTKAVDYSVLRQLYEGTPGLPSDKLKAVLQFLWSALKGKVNGVVFAYDEAQILEDHSLKSEYPLSMLLEIFQSLQKQGIPFMLVLTGLPTLTSKLVEARTYSERMFHVMFLSQLSPAETKEAIVRPTVSSPLKFENSEVAAIARLSGGYPYFIQFICREFFDACVANIEKGGHPSVPEAAIISKLDNDFFAGRWEKATDRERDLMLAIAQLDSCDDEFTVSEIVKISRQLLKKSFSPSLTNRMLARLSEKGLIFKNRHGKYSFAVPLLSRFIRRQAESAPDMFSLLDNEQDE